MAAQVTARALVVVLKLGCRTINQVTAATGTMGRGECFLRLAGSVTAPAKRHPQAMGRDHNRPVWGDAKVCGRPKPRSGLDCCANRLRALILDVLSSWSAGALGLRHGCAQGRVAKRGCYSALRDEGTRAVRFESGWASRIRYEAPKTPATPRLGWLGRRCRQWCGPRHYAQLSYEVVGKTYIWGESKNSSQISL